MSLLSVTRFSHIHDEFLTLSQFISEISDTVAACLLNLTDLSTGVQFEDPSIANLAGEKSPVDSKVSPHIGGPFRDLETNFRAALAESDESAIHDLIRFAGVLAQDDTRKPIVNRILWKIIIDAPAHFADMIMDSTSFDFSYVDDINGRTCLHEAAIAGASRLVEICLRKAVQPDKPDVYGRSALHYAAMQGNGDICRRLLGAHVPPDTLDVDSCSPLAYATMRGTVECLQVLLEQRSVLEQLLSSTGNNAPLLLASRSGRVDVVLLLLKSGAKSIPNTNGEYPMHLAAKEGHADVCRTLLGYEGWDVKDKYHEWTPLFHAARHGRMGCLDILLDAGARISMTDEFGYQAVHYAAWYGHHNCVNRLVSRALLSAASDMEGIEQRSPQSGKTEPVENEIDAIPSLSLPPPIMPHRVYGHNYLDKSFLVQVSVGSWSSSGASPSTGVVLHHRLIGDITKDASVLLPTSPSSPLPLKLVMTSPSSSSTPYTISLPQTSDQETFTFPVASLEGLSLEFSLYPSFGTKTIGRAVALPAWFRNMSRSGTFVLPILDRKLQLIGEVCLIGCSCIYPANISSP
jgi:CDK inhibitor PHO81